MFGFKNKEAKIVTLSAEVQEQITLAESLLKETSTRMKESDVHTNLTYNLQMRDSTMSLVKAMEAVKKGKTDTKSIKAFDHAYLSLKTISEHILDWKFDEKAALGKTENAPVSSANVPPVVSPVESSGATERTIINNTVGAPQKEKKDIKMNQTEKLCFASDYMEVAHENILKKLMEISLDKNPGYGSDAYTESATQKIREATACPNAEVIYLVGGTQTNQFVIDTTLAAYEGVVAAESGHVNVHEAGAIEYTGHKVMTVPQHLGKIDAKELVAFLETFWGDGNHEHMVYPGMVYISHPTEFGTLYSKKELQDISAACHRFNIPLYMDGARLGYGLMSPSTDLTLADIAELCDTFYIGGTKVGAMFGEAIVYTKNNKPSHSVTHVKQHGGLLAKGWLLGVQFDTLFTDDLYFKLGKNAIDTAMVLKKGLLDKGYPLYIDSPTNQQFIIVDNKKLAEISEKVEYSFWEKYGEDHTVIRFATSWATTPEQVEQLLSLV